MKATAGHARDSRRESDERADHGQESTDEHGQISPAQEEPISPVELATSHQNPAAVTLNQRTSTIASNLISDQRAQVAAERARRRHPQQFECAVEYEISGKGHDQFGRQRNARRLNRHEQSDAGIASYGDDLADKDEYDSEEFLSHSWENYNE